MSYTNPGPAILTGQISVMNAEGPNLIGNSSTSTVAFYGASPVQRPANAAQAALTLTTGLTGGVGFTTTTAFSAFTAQLENIRASLVLLGLLKGSA